MNVDKEVIESVAKNARISLSEEEKEALVKDFKEILSAFNEVAKAPAADEPAVHPVPVLGVTRDDLPGKCLSQKEALSNSPHNKDGFIKGPKVT